MDSKTHKTTFKKTTGVFEGDEPEKDYTYYWQLWHHNWDDQDAEVIKEVSSLKNKRVLEVGCGDGRLTFALAAECRSIIGVDLEASLIDSALARLKESAATNIEFKTMDAQNLQFEADSFDVVLFPWVLQMVSDPLQAVRESHRVLKAGGEIVIVGLRSDADYDKIIKEFSSQAFVIDADKTYESPLREVFACDTQQALKEKRQFDYFFANLNVAEEAFIFRT